MVWTSATPSAATDGETAGVVGSVGGVGSTLLDGVWVALGPPFGPLPPLPVGEADASGVGIAEAVALGTALALGVGEAEA